LRKTITSNIALSLLGIMAVILASVNQTAPAAPLGIDFADFRGTEAPLADGPDFRITDGDLFLFAVMTRLFDPELAVQWDDLTENERSTVRDFLGVYIQMLYNAREASREQTPQGLELTYRAQRLNAGPAAELLWADRVVRDTVHVFPEDMAYYYMSNRSEFSEEDSVMIRRLRVPLSSSAGVQERDEALERANNLREEAQFGDGLEPIIEANPDLLVDPPGRLVEITRSEEEMDPLIVDEAFRLRTSQISAPLRTPSGYVLVEVVERRQTEPTPLEDVLGEIEEELRENFLPQQFDYLLGREVRDARPTNRAHLFQFMPDDAYLLRVKDFQITLGEFKKLYPEIIGSAERPNKPAVFATTWSIINGEVATQNLEDLGYLKDPFYQRALDLAERMHLSAMFLRARRAESDPSREDIMEYLAEQRENLIPPPSKQVWSLSIVARDWDTLTRGERDSMRILMESYADQMAQEAERQIRERARVSPNSAYQEPGSVVRMLRQPSDPRVRIEFEPRGLYTGEGDTSQLGVEFDELVLGQFSDPVFLRDGSVASYYVSDIEEPAPVDDDQLVERARNQLIIEQSMQPAQKWIEEMENQDTLWFAPELR